MTKRIRCCLPLLVLAIQVFGQDQLYIIKLSSPYPDSLHGHIAWWPLSLNDSVIAWSDSAFYWELNLNTLQWSPASHGGLYDPMRNSNPTILPDGLWYYFSEMQYLKSFEPRDGTITIADRYHHQ